MVPAVEAQQLGKQFHVRHEKPALVKSVFPRWFRPIRHELRWALRGVSFRMAPGSSLAVIGSNGAGKSTLLHLLAGVVAPTEGWARIRGRAVPLLTLGVGFHPELTGEENLCLSAALLGMSPREIREKRGDILEFAGLDGFLDAPLGSYSSGMRLRLGFAVAAYAEGQAVLVDEVLTVGDLAFQRRCVERLERLRREGKTLVFVTQDLELAQRLGDRALLLHGGRLIEIGRPDRVVRVYRRLATSAMSIGETWLAEDRRQFVKRLRLHNTRRLQSAWGRRARGPEVEILEVRLLNRWGRRISRIDSGQSLTLDVRGRVHQRIEDPHIGIALFRDDQTYVFGPNTRFDGRLIPRLEPGDFRCSLTLQTLPLSGGTYRFSVVVWERHERLAYADDCGYYPLQIDGPSARSSGICAVPCSWTAGWNVRRRRIRLSAAEVSRRLETLQGLLHQTRHRSMVADASSVAMRLAAGRAPRVLHWGQSVELSLTVESQRDVPSSQVWLGVIRDPDGLLCAGWSTWSVDTAYDWTAGLAHISLGIAQWPLTMGRYRLTGAVWDHRGEVLQYHERLAVVFVGPGRPDHGMTYLPHQWRLEQLERSQ